MNNDFIFVFSLLDDICSKSKREREVFIHTFAHTYIFFLTSYVLNIVGASVWNIVVLFVHLSFSKSTAAAAVANIH